MYGWMKPIHTCKGGAHEGLMGMGMDMNIYI